MLCRNWLTKFTAVIQRQSLYSIVRRNPVEIIYTSSTATLLSITLTRIVAYLDYSQRHLTQTIIAVTSTLHTIASVSLPFRVTRADCSASPTNATNTGGQIALWRLTDRLQVILSRHKQQASSQRNVGRFDQTTAVMKYVSYNTIGSGLCSITLA